MPPNWTYLVQISSQSGSSENIDPKDTWFTPYLEEDPIETPTHMPRVAPENTINTFTSSKSVQQVHVRTFSEGAQFYEVIKLPVSKGV